MKTEYISDKHMSNISMTISSNNKRKHEDEEEKGYMKQARVTRIPLPILKQESYLAQLSLVEYLPIERIRALLTSNHLKTSGTIPLPVNAMQRKIMPMKWSNSMPT